MAHDLLTVLQAAQLLGMSSDAVRYYERRGRLNAFRIGTHRVFFRGEVERFKRDRDAEAQSKNVAEEVYA